MILVNPLPSDKLNSKNIIHVNNAIPKDYISSLKENIKQLKFEVDGGYSIKDKGNKLSSILPFDKSNLYYSLYTKLLSDYIIPINQEHFNFNINCYTELLGVNLYNPSNPRLGWHCDLGDKEYSYRKLSAVIMLSNPDEYIGGELEFFTGESSIKQNETKTISLNQGDIVVFPSYMLHKVNPVTKGERITIIAFAGNGKTFK